MNKTEITALNVNGKDSLWIDRGWRSADVNKDSGLSDAKLLGSMSTPGAYTDAGTDYAEVDTRNMSSFYNCRKIADNPTPYATTMLVGSKDCSTAHSQSSHELCSSGTTSLQLESAQSEHSHKKSQEPYPQYPPSMNYQIIFVFKQ